MRRGVMVGVVCVLLMVSLAPAVHAESRVVKDPSKDAQRIVDVVRAKFTNGDKAFRAVVKFRRLAKSGLALNVSVDSYDVAEWRNYNVGISINKKGKTFVNLIMLDEDGGAEVACKKASADWNPGKRGTIRLYAPRSCFDLSATVAMDALAVVEGDVGDTTEMVVVPQG